MYGRTTREKRGVFVKFLKQFGIILAISFVGEICNYFIPLPIPASIYGLVILFVGLWSGLIKLSSVKETGKFLIDIMPLMFIPAAVGLLECWGVLQPIWIPVVCITLLTTIIVMVITGRITQWLLQRKQNMVDVKDVEVEIYDA